MNTDPIPASPPREESPEGGDQFRALFESALDAIFVTDDARRYVAANPAACTLLGVPREEVVGRRIDDFTEPAFAPLMDESWREFLRRGEQSGEIRLLRPDGAFRDCDFNARANFVPGRHLSILRDVTARKQAEESLRENEERFRWLYDSNLIGVAFWNTGGFTADANDAYLRLLGYTREEFVAHGPIAWRETTPPEYEALDSRAVEEALVAGTSSVYEKEYVRRDGTRVPVVLGIALLNKSRHGVAFVLDITERKRAEAERAELLERERQARQHAETANRAKDEFLAVVSHELRTPLNSMLGWVRLLRSSRLDEATFARGLATIERNVLSQAQLIEDLLDVSRIITGKLRLDVRSVDLPPVIEAALDAVRPAADAKGIRLQPILDPGAGPIAGDPERLQQVVWNLLANAIKFTPKGGRVQVRLARVDSHAEITVSDTGSGIAPELLPQVFDRFWQADSSPTRHHGGLGLGLAIVRHLVELHGGAVRAESPGGGAGATFVVQLPLMVVRRKTEDEYRASSTRPVPVTFECPPELKRVRVLVVDDEPDTREMLAVVLGECGAEVRAAGSVGEALAALDEWPAGVLVSDIGMPGQDGYDLIRLVRERPAERAGAIPAVALTAYVRVEDRVRALAAGFQMHVAKPVEPAELVAVIASLVGLTGGPLAVADHGRGGAKTTPDEKS